MTVRALLAVALVLAVVGCSAGVEPAAVSVTPSASSTPFRSVRDLPVPADPVRLLVPTIGVDAVVGPLGRLPDGTADVPADDDEIGWYAEGPRPGEPGPAVLLGHVDAKAGPAVFFRLRELSPGDPVDVVSTDGERERFVVMRVERYPKDRFPTEEVYLPTLRPELRLVTCGGAFDRQTGHYVDNVIAFAQPAG